MTQTDKINTLLEPLPQVNPQIEVVENGEKKTDTSNIINSPVMQFIMLGRMNSQLTKIRKYFDDRRSYGWVQDFDNISVTSAEPSQEWKLDFPAQSISIINDGPALVYVEINDRAHTRKTLNAQEVFEVNFETHVLERFFVQCPSGLTATIRGTAKG